MKFSNKIATLTFLCAASAVSQVQAQQKPGFAWDDPAYPKKVATYQQALDWAVAKLPVLPIKEGAACKRDKDPALAFADGDAHTVTNAYTCGLTSWTKMPVRFSPNADSNVTVKKADLSRMETWIMERFPSLYNLGAKDATQAGVACAKQFEGVTGLKYAGGGYLSPVVSNVLRCEGGTWKTFSNLADLP